MYDSYVSQRNPILIYTQKQQNGDYHERNRNDYYYFEKNKS